MNCSDVRCRRNCRRSRRRSTITGTTDYPPSSSICRGRRPNSSVPTARSSACSSCRVARVSPSGGTCRCRCCWSRWR
ncbi:MAG: hypothetical protein KJS95_03770 [Gammaproteobacteria bacterium]|nr:hypothetical protein [Gammaproteobacteria bacterium]